MLLKQNPEFYASKICVFDVVQLEDDRSYIKSSHTDLSSSK